MDLERNNETSLKEHGRSRTSPSPGRRRPSFDGSHATIRRPKKKGSQSTLILALLFLSFYVNFHYLILQFTRTSTSAAYNPRTDLHCRMTAPLPPPVVSLNLTAELQALVNFDSAEMLLRTAWQGLIKTRSKNVPYRIITNLVPRKRIPKKDFGEEDFSLATHATVGRLDRLLEEYRRWDGPVSAAVYVASEEDIDILLAFLFNKGRMLKDIAIHVLMEDLSFKSKQYPNNILRNIAMGQLETDFFVALDVDFVTSVGAHGQLRELMTTYPNFTEVLRTKTLFVLPAFESVTYNETFVNETGHTVVEKRPKTLEAPDTKEEVIRQVKAGIVAPFHLKQFPPGHGPTRFPLYFANTTGPIYPITYHHRFEPYVLAYRRGLPKYWTGFRGYFFNKYSWFVETHSMGYEFAVLRDFFVFHVGLSGGSSRIPAWKSREWQKFLHYRDQVHGHKEISPYTGG
jgi:hypothetical protein